MQPAQLRRKRQDEAELCGHDETAPGREDELEAKDDLIDDRMDEMDDDDVLLEDGEIDSCDYRLPSSEKS